MPWVDPEMRLGRAVEILAHRIFIDKREALAELNISPAQYEIMNVVEGDFGPNGADIAHVVGSSPQSVTPLLKALITKDLAERYQRPGNGREFNYRLTPAGETLLERAREKIKGVEDFLDAGFYPDRHEKLHEYLHHALSIMCRRTTEKL